MHTGRVSDARPLPGARGKGRGRRWKGPPGRFPTRSSYPGFWEESEIPVMFTATICRSWPAVSLPLPSVWLGSCHSATQWPRPLL